ncbi:MAG: hypothetical protein V1816_14735 [Pseudomonadota bacterium]
MKLVPNDNNLNINIDVFEISRVSRNFAKVRLLQKITNVHPIYRGLNPKLLLPQLKSKNNDKPELECLNEAYNDCFNASLNLSYTRYKSHPALALDSDGNLSHIIVEQQVMPKPKAPDISAFGKINPIIQNGDKPIVDVIVPVFKGYDDTLACIYSVLTSNGYIPF